MCSIEQQREMDGIAEMRRGAPVRSASLSQLQRGERVRTSPPPPCAGEGEAAPATRVQLPGKVSSFPALPFYGSKAAPFSKTFFFLSCQSIKVLCVAFRGPW